MLEVEHWRMSGRHIGWCQDPHRRGVVRWTGSNLGGVMDAELDREVDCNHRMWWTGSGRHCWREQGDTQVDCEHGDEVGRRPER